MGGLGRWPWAFVTESPFHTPTCEPGRLPPPHPAASVAGGSSVLSVRFCSSAVVSGCASHLCCLHSGRRVPPCLQLLSCALVVPGPAFLWGARLFSLLCSVGRQFSRNRSPAAWPGPSGRRTHLNSRRSGALDRRRGAQAVPPRRCRHAPPHRRLRVTKWGCLPVPQALACTPGE